jgi:hypothetical protein
VRLELRVVRRRESDDCLGEDAGAILVEVLDEGAVPTVEAVATDGLADRDDDKPAADGRPALEVVAEQRASHASAQASSFAALVLTTRRTARCSSA